MIDVFVYTFWGLEGSQKLNLENLDDYAEAHNHHEHWFSR